VSNYWTVAILVYREPLPFNIVIMLNLLAQPVHANFDAGQGTVEATVSPSHPKHRPFGLTSLCVASVTTRLHLVQTWTVIPETNGSPV
jgi:hypothetical protein